MATPDRPLTAEQIQYLRDLAAAAPRFSDTTKRRLRSLLGLGRPTLIGSGRTADRVAR